MENFLLCFPILTLSLRNNPLHDQSRYVLVLRFENPKDLSKFETIGVSYISPLTFIRYDKFNIEQLKSAIL